MDDRHPTDRQDCPGQVGCGCRPQYWDGGSSAGVGARQAGGQLLWVRGGIHVAQAQAPLSPVWGAILRRLLELPTAAAASAPH
jgi:hypothetical protein